VRDWLARAARLHGTMVLGSWVVGYTKNNAVAASPAE